MSATLSIFFSYVDLDAGAANQIKLIFGTLRNDFRIGLTVQQPLPNDSNEDPNLSALRECDLAVILMSKAYVRTEYMRRRMLPAILSRMEAGDCLVLPIYLEATERDGSPLVGTPIAKIPPRPLNTYTDPKQGYLIIENRLRKFLEAQGYSRFASAGLSPRVLLTYGMIGLLLLAGWLYWNNRNEATAKTPLPVVQNSVIPPPEPDSAESKLPPAPESIIAAPCIPPPIFPENDTTACTRLTPAAQGFRGCKYQKIFYVLTPECDTIRLDLPIETHHDIYKMGSYEKGRAPVYFKSEDKLLYIAFWVDTLGLKTG